METHKIYTIGHGNRNIENFLEILKNFNIQYLLDIRSQPYSKFNPDFNQNELKFFLKKRNIIYGFFGKTLGGRPNCPNCYDDDGKVDYDKVKQQDFFVQGLSRIETAYQKQLRVVLMCSESKPEECHRTKLIGNELINNDIEIAHISEKGILKSQNEIMLKLTKGKNIVDLFGNVENFTSRKPYLNLNNK